MASPTRIWLFLYFLVSSSLNFLALGFFAVYADIGNTMTHDFAQVWIWGILGLAIVFWVGWRFVESSAMNLQQFCTVGTSALRLVSIFTFAVGFFKATQFVLDEWNEPDVFHQLLMNRETALLSLLLGALFLRCGWKLEPTDDQSEVQETFRFFLYSARHRHDTTVVSPQIAAPVVLVFLALLSLDPPLLFSSQLDLKPDRVNLLKDYGELQDLFSRARELESGHSKWSYSSSKTSRSEEDVKSLIEALELYQQAESKAGALHLSADFAGSASDCLLGQARTLILLGHYDEAWPILNEHRTTYKKEWSQIGWVHRQSAPMPVEDFVLVFLKAGQPEIAFRLCETANSRGHFQHERFQLLKLLACVQAGYWNVAETELASLRQDRRSQLDLSELERLVKKQDSNVEAYLESLGHSSVPIGPEG